MNSIKIDFSKQYGEIKPFNAINNGPKRGLRGFSNVDSWSAAKIPYGRLHDTSYLDEWLVDVHRIFRDFDADENDPANYIFKPTDAYIARMIEAGTEPYYRLGASIEHSHKLGTYPPKDYLKWARICEHIIRHYTEGWADGFNYKIEYWEIWNEHDNIGVGRPNPCWQGTQEEFAEFFAVACKYLQEKFPGLKIGGPAFATTRHEDICDIFFDGLKKHSVRPDFISYHRYTGDVDEFVDYVKCANKLFERHGFGDIETHINEWNYVRGWRGDDYVHSAKSIKGLKGSSFVAASMCALHPEKLDMLMYYDGALSEWNGLYGQFLVPLKGYYPFLAFSHLRDLGTAAESESSDHIYSLGATDGESAAIMLTHFSDTEDSEEKTVRLKVRGIKVQDGKMLRVKYLVLDDGHDLECTREELFASGDFDVFLKLPLYTTYLLKICAEDAEV